MIMLSSMSERAQFDNATANHAHTLFVVRNKSNPSLDIELHSSKIFVDR